MGELLVWFFSSYLVDVVLIGTGWLIVRAISLGRWRSEAVLGREGRIHGAAGALSFVRDGRRVVTHTGMLFIGIVFYVGLTLLLIVRATHG